MKSYYNQLGSIPKITDEEEIKLMRSIYKGRIDIIRELLNMQFFYDWVKQEYDIRIKKKKSFKTLCTFGNVTDIFLDKIKDKLCRLFKKMGTPSVDMIIKEEMIKDVKTCIRGKNKYKGQRPITDAIEGATNFKVLSLIATSCNLNNNEEDKVKKILNSYDNSEKATVKYLVNQFEKFFAAYKKKSKKLVQIFLELEIKWALIKKIYTNLLAKYNRHNFNFPKEFLLSKDEAEPFIKKIKRSQNKVIKARNRMIEGNMTLIPSFIKKYSSVDYTPDDILQEGNIGLISAIERFDLRKGFKISTYSAWWIKQAIIRGLSYNSKTIRVPDHIKNNASAIKQFIVSFVEKHKREPSNYEIHKATGIPYRRIIMMEEMYTDAVPIDKPVGSDDDGSATIGDFIADDKAKNPEKEILDTEKTQKVKEFLQYLKPDEREAIKYYLGIDNNGDGIRPKEISRKMGVSRKEAEALVFFGAKKMKRLAMKGMK